MSVKDQLAYIQQHMKKNKLRVFMTVLAATMGCAFLIVLASVGFGLHKTIKEEMLSNQLITEIQVWGKEDGSGPLVKEDIEPMKNLPDVEAVVTRSYVHGIPEFHLDGRTGSGEVILTDVKEEAKAELQLAEGTIPDAPNEVLVGYHFAERLLTDEEKVKWENGEIVGGYTGELIGKAVQLEFKPYEPADAESKTWEFVISGIIKEPSKDWMVDTRMLINESWQTEFHTFLMPENEEIIGYSSVSLYADNVENVKGITDQLKGDGYYVYSITEELETLNLFFTALKAGLLFVGTIAVLIASIGIFNTMTMAVTERTREIGIMKAIGAKPKLIQKLFLMESLWIGVLGTVIAIAISYGVSFLANWLIPEIVMGIVPEEGISDFDVTVSLIPWELVLIASAISIGVAMISGWRPARKATKIDVIRALRQEL